METLCRLKPLHPGLSLTVLKNLGWSEISVDAPCQCWRQIVSELRPGQRAMVYTALQEVMQLHIMCCFLSPRLHGLHLN